MSESIGWHDWSERAFARAAAERKPVLLSLVTAWSAECAAMDRTTYAHPLVVSLVDERFVPIRVDADRRPDVNERYNLGGWPTTACLTSDGDVLNAGTYFDADRMMAMLQQVADAWRDRSAEILARAHARKRVPAAPASSLNLSVSATDYFRSLLIDRFDAVHGGFGGAPKVPHARALNAALVLGDNDAELSEIVEVTLDKMNALWDPDGGGFFRYARNADWSGPGAEKTLEDNAALLHVYIEAAIRRHSEEFRNRAAELVRWITRTLADETDGGFYNAQAGVVVDRSMYVDRNAEMVSAFLRAAALFDDPWLRDFALRSLERVILPGYSPGGGVGHISGPAQQPSQRTNNDVRGLLADQIAVASALIWAHAATGQLPYSMLAAELTQYTIRTMWDEEAGSFRDRAMGGPDGEIGLLRETLTPFDINCDAASTLERLATLTGDRAYHDRALTILQSLGAQYPTRGLFGASYALAAREVIEGCAPVRLELTRVDWHLP
jgi:uncharacterized protein YyaL (SSP411 family)